MKDLFGEEIDDYPLNRRGGHAATPGTGPAGERCKTCRHYTLVQMTKRHFRKCGLMAEHWTGGPGTDVRASDPACRFFEKKEPQP